MDKTTETQGRFLLTTKEDMLQEHGFGVTETIRICKDRNVLREYLLDREKEVVTIMMSLFDEEQIMKSFIKSERHDAERAMVEQLIRKGKMIQHFWSPY